MTTPALSPLSQSWPKGPRQRLAKTSVYFTGRFALDLRDVRDSGRGGRHIHTDDDADGIGLFLRAAGEAAALTVRDSI